MKGRKKAHVFDALNVELRTSNVEHQTSNGERQTSNFEWRTANGEWQMAKQEAGTFQMIISWPILDGSGKSRYGVKAEKKEKLWERVSNHEYQIGTREF